LSQPCRTCRRPALGVELDVLDAESLQLACPEARVEGARPERPLLERDRLDHPSRNLGGDCAPGLFAAGDDLEAGRRVDRDRVSGAAVHDPELPLL
jgi:hypothetical protein